MNKPGRKKAKVPFFQYDELYDMLNDYCQLDRSTHDPHSKAREIVQTILRVMKEALHRGERVSIGGFGILEVRDIPARKARGMNVDNKFNGLKTNEVTIIPAKKRVAFKPSLVLTALMNQDNPDKREAKILARGVEKA